MIYHLGLLGYPVSHSLSPKLQNAALRAAGLDGEYKLFPIDPAQPELLAQLLDRVRANKIHGLNVTIPHKQNVIPLLDDLTPVARAIGAVNVIYKRDDQLIGDNTDAAGFVADLKNFCGAEYDSRTRVIVLGAGGSARSVIYALTREGRFISVFTRRREQAHQLVEDFHSAGSHNNIQALENIIHINIKTDLIINTTPVGMIPNIDVSPWPDALELPKGALIYDLIYNPRETLFVKQARAAGLRATTGLGMLIEQALLGFKIWTGRTVPRAVMFSAMEA
jgi:shikimate dehydrogenase